MKYKESKLPYILISVLLLALICVGTAELAACRVADPVLYHRVTGPVVSAAQRAAAAAGDTVDSLGQTASRLGQSVSLRIAEAAAMLEEAQLQDDEPVPLADLPAADPVVTALESADGLDRLTGGSISVVYYNQKDEQWAAQPYGSDPIGRYGCGPTSMAIIISSLQEDPADPAAMARQCSREGYWCRGQGSYLSIVSGISEAYGLSCTAAARLDAETLVTHLAGGDLAVALMTKGHFTSGGHFIVLRGLTLEGEVLVADPASLERSLVPWDPAVIIDELSPSRHAGAPLWFISKSRQ